MLAKIECLLISFENWLSENEIHESLSLKYVQKKEMIASSMRKLFFKHASETLIFFFEI